MRVIILVISMLCMTTMAMALTLGEAVSLSMENSDSIKQTSSMLEAKRYSKDSAYATFLPTADLSYEYSDSKAYRPRTNARGSDLSVELGLNLFNGLYDYNTLKQSKKEYERQEYTHTANVQDLVLNTKSAYINYLKRVNQLNVAKETLTLLQAQKDIAETSYRVGQFSKVDVLKVDVQLAASELDVLNAEINMKLARKELEKQIGRYLFQDEPVEDIETDLKYLLPNIDSLYNMLEERSELMNIKLSYDTAVLEKDKARAGFMPRLDVGYRYSWYGDEVAPDGRDKILTPDRSGAAFLRASWNIFRGGYDYNTYKANSLMANATAHGVSDLRKDLRLSLDTVYENYFSAKERLVVAQVGVKQAEENYRVTKSQYEHSSATTTDLLDASVMLHEAHNSFTSARYDIVLAVAQLERAVERNFLVDETIATE